MSNFAERPLLSPIVTSCTVTMGAEPSAAAFEERLLSGMGDASLSIRLGSNAAIAGRRYLPLHGVESSHSAPTATDASEFKKHATDKILDDIWNNRNS
jgi:hypothetical protein